MGDTGWEERVALWGERSEPVGAKPPRGGALVVIDRLKLSTAENFNFS